ncbi:MAG: helix-turn-helix transcriptional regulator [Ruminococcus sp.]|nr:helix-turn-helix transcriptional regulator [Ruminococcus sp.]
MIMKIGERIMILRERKGYTQKQLAQRLGISRNAVNLWEMSMSSPSMESLIELSKIFHVSTDYLLGLETDEKIDISDLTEEEKKILFMIISYFDNNKQNNGE